MSLPTGFCWILRSGLTFGTEHEANSSPFETAAAESERFKGGEFSGVELEPGFAGDGVGGFGDAVEPQPAVDAAEFRVGSPAGRGEGLVQLVKGTCGGVDLVAAAGFHFDGGDVDATFVRVERDGQ